MMLGQASAYAASLAIDANTNVQSIPVAKVRERVGAAEGIAAVKPASPEEPDKNPSTPTGTEKERFLAAVASLKKAGALKGDTQWIDQLKTNVNIDGAKVGELLIGFASLTKPADALDTALDQLASNKALPDAKGYWRANAREGQKCAPRQVMQLCMRLANSLK